MSDDRKQINVRIDDETWQRWNTLADNAGLTLSEYVRRQVDRQPLVDDQLIGRLIETNLEIAEFWWTQVKKHSDK